MITLCAVAAGADCWEDIYLFAEEREEWLSQFLELPAGIPSIDTLARVLSILEPLALETALQTLMELLRRALLPTPLSEIIALDGKVLKRSFDQATGKSAIHIVSAWAVEAGVLLGQCKVDEKSNEITAVPDLIRRMAIQGATLTTDALNANYLMHALFGAPCPS